MYLQTIIYLSEINKIDNNKMSDNLLDIDKCYSNKHKVAYNHNNRIKLLD